MKPRWRAAWLACVIGCQGQPGDASERAAEAVAAIDSQAFVAWAAAKPSQPAKCSGFRARKLDSHVRLRVFLGQGVRPGAARRALESMLSYFGEYGVAFDVQAPVRRLAEAELIGRGRPEQALSGLSDFLARHAPAPPAGGAFTLNAVVLGRIASASSPASRYFDELTGLSIGDHLRAARDPLADALKIAGPITPTLLLGLDDMQKRRPGSVDLTAAHELGHLLGLKHAAGADLMNPAPQACAPPLQAAQLQALAAATHAKRPD